MRNTASRRRFAKYAPLGGIANAAKNIFNGSWTLQHAARRISVTRECVRQDLCVLIGAGQYKRRVAARKARLKQSRQPRTLSTTQAIRFLSHRQEFRSGPAPRFLKYIIKRCLASGLRLALRVCTGKRPVLLTPAGRPMSVRIVFPDGSVRENAFGLHRINISRLQGQNPPVAVFLLRTPTETCSYVFRTKDLARVNSLVLRYQALDRKAKYSQALNNWKAIAGS
ncbi:MAG: hypothetical protein ABSD29_21220 [Verrucomicrobiota bacterium]|jgi:hypothetical protein